MKDKAKTMSTLQMWQQQMAALQRASQARVSETFTQQSAQLEKDKTNTSRSRSQLIYPLLP